MDYILQSILPTADKQLIQLDHITYVDIFLHADKE